VKNRLIVVLAPVVGDPFPSPFRRRVSPGIRPGLPAARGGMNKRVDDDIAAARQFERLGQRETRPSDLRDSHAHA